jgi:hypothetical protein
MRFTEEGVFERVFEGHIRSNHVREDTEKFLRELDGELIQARHQDAEVVVDIWKELPKKGAK